MPSRNPSLTAAQAVELGRKRAEEAFRAHVMVDGKDPSDFLIRDWFVNPAFTLDFVTRRIASRAADERAAELRQSFRRIRRWQQIRKWSWRLIPPATAVALVELARRFLVG